LTWKWFRLCEKAQAAQHLSTVCLPQNRFSFFPESDLSVPPVTISTMKVTVLLITHRFSVVNAVVQSME
jgi:hypothetical protein